MANPGFLVNAQVLASKTAILSLLQNCAIIYNHNVNFTNICKSNTLEKNHGMSNFKIQGKTASIINLKSMHNMSPKRCVSSALLSKWTLPLSNRLLNPKTTDNVNLRYFSIDCSRRAKVIDGRTTEDQQDQKEGKLITKIEDIEEEEVHNKSSTKSDIYEPLNMKAIEEITEKVEKFASVYLTQQHREKFIQIFKSNLVAIAMSKRAELRGELMDRQRSLISKLASEREDVAEYNDISPKLSQQDDIIICDSTDFRLTSIVLPDITSATKAQDNVEAKEILNDNLVKITESTDENPTNDEIKTTANKGDENKEGNKQSD